jgi:hypothetical protein
MFARDLTDTQGVINMAEQAKKASAKRKTTAPKTTTRKTTARKTTSRRSAPKKATATVQGRVSEASRKAFLASLGFYGMAFDQVQDSVKTVESRLSARRKKADKLYTDMVKRGQKVEKQAKARLDDIELPRFELEELANRAKLEAQLKKARARFAELKASVRGKAAA